MARQVLPIVGAIVGGYFGGPSGAQAGWALGSVIGGAIDPVVNKGPSLGDLPTQTSYEGSPRAVIYGTTTCTGYIAAFGEPVKSTESSGDKGGSETESEVVHRSYLIAICEGPIGGVLRVWENDTMVYDMRTESEMVEESVKWLKNKGFILGGEELAPDPLVELNITAPGETPGFSGTALLRVIEEDLTNFRGAIPQYRFEVAKAVHSIEPEPIILPKILANRAITNLTGGGLFGETWTPYGSMSSPGSVWLASWGFGQIQANTQVTVRIEVNGVIIWSRSYTTAANTAEYKAQINLPPGSSVRIGFVYGDGFMRLTNFTLAVFGVTTAAGNQKPYWPGDEDDLPLVFETDYPYFGVVLDGAGEMGSMYVFIPGYFSEDWGPPEFIPEPDPGLIGEPQTLASIVGDLHYRSSVAAADYDVSDLEDISVRGLTLQSADYTAADAVSQLQGCYFFSKQEPGDKIYYPLRGKPVVATLTIDDLVEIPDTSRREQAAEVPRKVNLMYQNAVAGYAPVKATFSSSSPDNKSTLEITTQVAVVLDVDESAQMVNKIYKAAVADAQGEIKLSVPEKFIRLVPADCIGLSLRGRVIRLRIDNSETADGVINLTCRVDRQSAYTSNITGIEIPPSVTPPSTISGPTQFVYLDIPARIDMEDDLNYLVAGTSARDGWPGWALQRSLDSGANYSTVDRWNDRAVMGALLDPLPAASEHYTDTTNKVRLELYRKSQTIDSITEMQFLSEGGALAIARPDGSAEVIQYLDANDETEGVFELSTLHRGLLNTGGTAHAAGAKIVMLTSAKHVPAQSSWIGRNLVHRAVSIGETSETATPSTDPFVGRSQIEWPVAELSAERGAPGVDIGVITGTWVPRHRFGSDVAPVASINFQGFRVVIDDGTTVFTLPDSMETSFSLNFQTVATPATVTVYPINRITGLGPGVSVTV